MAAALAGCSGDDVEPEPDVDWRGKEYVALGDSYTAAPGVGEVVHEGCRRTDGNYPNRIAEALELELVDVSCSAATSDHLIEPQRAAGIDVPPQLDALSESTDLVTLRIGANDLDRFVAMVNTCVTFGARGVGESPCPARLEADTAELGRSLAELIEEILRRAPEATVVVVGYPQFAPPPETEGCDQFPLAAGDYAPVATFNADLNAVLGAAAVEYDAAVAVDVAAATAEHHMCAEEPWVAGAAPTGPAMPFHPYAAEQRATADLVVAALTGPG
jgi:lysophospholipase L1-like esterase